MFTWLTDVFDFFEGLFKTAASGATTIPGIATTAITAITSAQAVVALTENLVQLSAHEQNTINTALSNALTYAKVLQNEPTQTNLTTLIKACTDVVAATPAGSIHDKLAAIMAVVTIANALYQQTMGAVPLTVPTVAPETQAPAQAPAAAS
jgi:hypothetical protein